MPSAPARPRVRRAGWLLLASSLTAAGGEHPTAIAPPGPPLASGPCALHRLAGSWEVVSLTVDGDPSHDDEMAGARLTFGGDRLAIDTAAGEHLEFALRVEPRSRPCAFHATPRNAATEPSGWMLYETDGTTLRLGFHDNLERRASGFDSRDDMVVLRLSRPVSGPGAPGRERAR